MNLKSYLFIITCVFFFDNPTNAQWQNVGVASFSTGDHNLVQNMAFDPLTNEPYVVETDVISSSNNILIHKFNGTNWQQIGAPAFSNRALLNSNLVFHPSTNEPYFAFEEMDLNFNRLGTTIVHYSSGSWQTVGTPQITHINSPCIAFHPATNELYMAYRDFDHGPRISVMKYNGSIWQDVGTRGFSLDDAFNINLTFHPGTNEPYVNYTAINTDSIFTKKFNGNSWQEAYPSIYNPGVVGFAHEIAFHPTTHEIYMFQLDASNQRTIVMKFDGNNWQQIGNSISNAPDFILDIVFQPITDIPYIYYSTQSNGDRIVKKYSSGTWSDVGTPVSNNGVMFYGNLAFHPTSHNPYFVYPDGNNNTTVVKYNNIPTSFTETIQKKELNIYPNPFHNKTIIDLNGTGSIRITNALGKIVKELEHHNQTEITLPEKGIYFLQLTIDDKVYSTKLVHQ